MKGNLEKIGNKWFVRYVRYEGRNSFRLPLHPNFVEMTDFVYIKNERFYDGDEIEFIDVLVNPMGRDVDPNNLGQNHSLCKWYAKPYLDEKEEPKQVWYSLDKSTNGNLGITSNGYWGNEPKEEQKQHLIDMMKGDEELGLYNEPREIKIEDIFNDEKREKVKRVIHQHKVLQGLSLVNPAHLEMTSNGHGEFPDGYKLTEKGIQYIIEQLNKE
jgi:hypothetical protein